MYNRYNLLGLGLRLEHWGWLGGAGSAGRGGGSYVRALSRARERGGKGECAILVPYLGGRSGVNGGPVLAALAGLMERGGGGGRAVGPGPGGGGWWSH